MYILNVNRSYVPIYALCNTRHLPTRSTCTVYSTYEIIPKSSDIDDITRNIMEYNDIIKVKKKTRNLNLRHYGIIIYTSTSVSIANALTTFSI